MKVIIVQVDTVWGESTTNYSICRTMKDCRQSIKELRKKVRAENKQLKQENIDTPIRICIPQCAVVEVGQFYHCGNGREGFLVEQHSTKKNEYWILWEYLQLKPGEYGYYEIATNQFINDNDPGCEYDDLDASDIKRFATRDISKIMWRDIDPRRPINKTSRCRHIEPDESVAK